MDVDLSEARPSTRAVGPHTLARGSGKVINIASWTPYSGGRGMVTDTTAKTARAGFTRAQPLEWAPCGVQVNAIAPGLFPDIVTAGEERFRQLTRRTEQTVPLGWVGRLRKVGLLALYLASEASDQMTERTVLLDAGWGCSERPPH
jgi:2-deoxy-D-gluconate 3-dehydrogenase